MSDPRNDVFRIMITDYMLNRMDDLEKDRIRIMNNIQLRCLNVDRYYDLIVNEIRTDYARMIFRHLRTLLDDYLD